MLVPLMYMFTYGRCSPVLASKTWPWICESVFVCACIFVFNGDDSKGKPVKTDNEETDNVLSKDKMIEIVDLYGKTLELEINNYYNVNNKLPDFSTVNNLVNLDHEVVCHIHEIYADKTVYLDDCMVDYTDIDHSYGTKKEIVEE